MVTIRVLPVHVVQYNNGQPYVRWSVRVTRAASRQARPDQTNRPVQSSIDYIVGADKQNIQMIRSVWGKRGETRDFMQGKRPQYMETHCYYTTILVKVKKKTCKQTRRTAGINRTNNTCSLVTACCCLHSIPLLASFLFPSWRPPSFSLPLLAILLLSSSLLQHLILFINHITLYLCMCFNCLSSLITCRSGWSAERLLIVQSRRTTTLIRLPSWSCRSLLLRVQLCWAAPWRLTCPRSKPRYVFWLDLKTGHKADRVFWIGIEILLL